MREKRPEFKSEAGFAQFQADRAASWKRSTSGGVEATRKEELAGPQKSNRQRQACGQADLKASRTPDCKHIAGIEPGPLTLSLVLPWPPSGNHGTKHTTTGLHYLTEPHKRFRKAVKSICMQVRAHPVPSPYRCAVEWYAPDLRERDSDNLQKVLFDALRHAGVISGDSLRDKIEYREVAIIPAKPCDGAVHVRIEQA